jgi:hypothetical protein
MDFVNPTSLKLGQQGTLDGKDYRVAGRVVLGEIENGRTYYWQEFHLAATTGDTATLVFELTEFGPQWRLFTEIEPSNPLTAAQAAGLKMGTRFNLGDGEFRVSFISKSQVYLIEGEAPPGVELGDVAQYINGECGCEKVVVSWTGDEVEFFQGKDLSWKVVRSAFDLEQAEFVFPPYLKSEETSDRRIWIALIALLGVTVIGILFLCRSGLGSSADKVIPARSPNVKLVLAAKGLINDRNYLLCGHSVVDIAAVEKHFQRHEFNLSGDEDSTAFLAFGLAPHGEEWVLYESVSNFELTPQKAASKQVGETVLINNTHAIIREEFLTTYAKIDGVGIEGSKPGSRFYGFRAESGWDIFLVRWNENKTVCYQGKSLTRGDLVKAFGVKQK